MLLHGVKEQPTVTFTQSDSEGSEGLIGTMEGTSGDQVGSRIPQPPAERQNEMSRAPTKFLTTQEIQQVR